MNTNSNNADDSDECPDSRAQRAKSSFISAGTTVFKGSVDFPIPGMEGLENIGSSPCIGGSTLALWADLRVRICVRRAERAVAAEFDQMAREFSELARRVIGGG
jgi:hypothetical protein